MARSRKNACPTHLSGILFVMRRVRRYWWARRPAATGHKKMLGYLSHDLGPVLAMVRSLGNYQSRDCRCWLQRFVRKIFLQAQGTSCRCLLLKTVSRRNNLMKLKT